MKKLLNKLKYFITFILIKLKIMPFYRFIDTAYTDGAIQIGLIHNGLNIVQTLDINGNPISELITFSFIRGAHSNDIKIRFSIDRNIRPYNYDIAITTSEFDGLTLSDLTDISAKINQLNNSLKPQILATYTRLHP